MKKLLVLLAGLTASSLYASPVLNPAAPALNTDGLFYCCPDSCWSLRAGFRGDYVFDRKLEDAVHSINNYSLFSNEGALTLNLWNRLDIYGFVGATSQNLASVYPGTLFSSFDEVAYTTETIWGVGGKWVFWEWDWTCHCGRSFLALDANYESVSSANPAQSLVNKTPLSGFPEVSYHETQVSLAWGHRVKNLIPYIAVKWSNARANMPTTSVVDDGEQENTQVLQDLKNRNSWGWALGCSLVDVGRMTVSAEARFVDEKAMTVTGSFRV